MQKLDIDIPADKVKKALLNFTDWLSQYGETSYDHQTFYSGPIGRRAKSTYYRKPLSGILAVAPMVFLEAFFPRGRSFFWKKQRLPIADAHYAMGFIYLARAFNSDIFFSKAEHFLDVLIETRCPKFRDYCWGYPFDWVTRGGTIPSGVPLITTTPYVYEAFHEAYDYDGNNKWLQILKSIADHVAYDIKDLPVSKNSKACAYTPADQFGVINASAYRAFTLASASVLFSDKKYLEVAEYNLNFVLENQSENGSWPYSANDQRDFIDHFHTCFVLKALSKIDILLNHSGCRKAIQKGVSYYLQNLFDPNNLPKPFSKAPRMTVYKKELYDYAECINLWILLRQTQPEIDATGLCVLRDILGNWIKKDGSFRSRKLLFGWDNVPMHRWAQSQMFRSLSFLHATTLSSNSER